MNRSIDVAGWYLQETLRVMGAYAIPERVSDAHTLWEWFIGQEKSAYSARDVATYGPYALRKDKTRRDAALLELEQRGYVVLVRKGKGRTYHINPKATESENE